jgi:hypothetical protein
MGLLTEFFVSSDQLAPKFTGDDTWPSADVLGSKGLTPLHMALLWAALDGVEYDDDMGDAFEEVKQPNENQWIYRFPPQMVKTLAESGSAALDRATAEWAAAEEMESDPKDIRPLVDDLQQLAKNAYATKRSLHIWCSM